MGLSRRDFVKKMGTGTVLTGLSGMAGSVPVKAQTAAAGTSIPLPKELEAQLQQRLEPPLFARSAGSGLKLYAEGNTNTDPLAAETVQVAPNLEPVILHPDQGAAAQAKLAALAQKTGKKPNILVFVMDDVGWGDPGCYGGGVMAGAPTPNMDRLAKEGLQLISCYSQPTCSPSRATLLTGRLPIRHGILRPTAAGEQGGLQNEITLAQLLGQAGYVTQAVGKWHLGENEASQPHRVGFDDFYGFLSVSENYTEWRDSYFNPDITLNPDRTAMVKAMPFNRNLVHARKGGTIENLEEITIPVCAELDSKWATYSADFITSMAKSDRPFFLYHCTRGAHFDNYPNPSFAGKSLAKYPYKDVIVELDDILGRLVQALDDTGQLENTLIFVTSDNGPQIEIWPDTGYTPFRCGKWSTWEGGVRMPGIVYWKNMISPGQVSNGLFDFADLLPTSLALAGASNLVPGDRYIDGIDQTSFLLADAGLSNRKFVYYWLGATFSAVRAAEYKFVAAGISGDDGDTVNPGGWTSLETYPQGKLFNLYLDPKEEHSFLVRKTILIDIFVSAVQRHKATLA